MNNLIYRGYEVFENLTSYNVYGNNDELLRICPGITFRSSNSGQVRTVSPTVAQKAGADYIIIGRSITKANKPLETLKMIKSTLRNTG